MKRRDFVRVLGGAVIAGTALAACGGDDDGNGGGADAAPAANCPGATISGNHGHVATIPRADVTAGAEKTYNIDGTAGHPHTITLSAADMTTLQGGGSVTVPSSNDAAHAHDVTVTCP